MKKVFLVLSFALAMTSFAQNSIKEDVEIVQSVYGKSKSELVTQYMALSADQAALFAKVYDAYEVERKKLGKERVELINQYAINYAALTDDKVDAIVKGTLKNNQALDKLYLTYYEKTKKAIGALNAAKFIQLEIYLQTEIRSALQNSIPFIGEIDMSKTK